MSIEALQLREELILGILQTDNYDLLEKLNKYFKKTKAKMSQAKIADETIGKEDILAGIDAGLKDVKEGRMMSMDQFYRELERL